MHAPSAQSAGCAPGTAPSLSLASRIADYSVIALAIILGVGSIVLFAWPHRPAFLPLGLSPGATVWWNALVSFVFFAQHSLMVRRSVRARLAAVIPSRYDGAGPTPSSVSTASCLPRCGLRGSMSGRSSRNVT